MLILRVLPADKDNTTLILNTSDYTEEVMILLEDSAYKNWLWSMTRRTVLLIIRYCHHINRGHLEYKRRTHHISIVTPTCRLANLLIYLLGPRLAYFLYHVRNPENLSEHWRLSGSIRTSSILTLSRSSLSADKRYLESSEPPVLWR